MRVYILIALIAAIVTYLLTPVVRKLAVNVGAITPVRDRDVHSVPVPRLGGIAMLLGLIAAMLIASQTPFLARIFADGVPWAVAGAAAIVCVLGVADDLWDLDWFTKLAGQILAAVFLAWKGVQLVTFPIFGLTIGSSRLSLIATVLVVVVAINAVNFVDGLDGLAAGMLAIGGMAFFLYAYFLTREENSADYSSLAALIICLLVGMCLGFLPHNFHPSRIFMGDSGAMVLGMIVAAAAISVTGQIDPGMLQASQAIPVFVPILLPVAVLLLPLIDMVWAVIRRLAAGKTPFEADRMHIHHRLLNFGHSHRGSVLIMYVWTAVAAFSAVSLAFWEIPVVLAGSGIGIVLAILATRWIPQRQRVASYNSD